MSQIKTIVKSTKYSGLGVFTISAIRSNVAIAEIKGNFVHWKILLKIGGIIQDNAIRITHDYYLSPSDLGNFLNHSCKPNTKIVIKNNRMCLEAIHKIAAGEELTFDYSTIIGADDIWKMKCHCGLPQCRKIIRSFNTLPKQLQEYYIQQNAVPQVILKTMQNT